MLKVVICFQFSIFEPLDTTNLRKKQANGWLWFAFNLVSLNHWTQRWSRHCQPSQVVICFQFSIFEPLDTTLAFDVLIRDKLWFAFNLVSLNHWTQLWPRPTLGDTVVICFQFSIFEPLDTTDLICLINLFELWFAFNLVSLNHLTQRAYRESTIQVSCDLLSI